MSDAGLVTSDGFDSDEARRKRLGQYFSGNLLSRLLLAIASRPGIRHVIDPMAGRGDMLVASKQLINRCDRLDGIELDFAAHADCVSELCKFDDVAHKCVRGNAFDRKVLSLICSDGYDLVATNPPYVRYQSLKHSVGSDSRLPSALEIRNGLRECIEITSTLDETDKLEFLNLVDHYSGLSDMAVPSWILCAALVKPGGTLAMVLPDAWLNRDYATVVQYLLLKWFRIEFVVEDSHASWFSNAQIKTNLLIARRIPRRESAYSWVDEEYVHIGLTSALADHKSLVGRGPWATHKFPEKAFARQARILLNGKTGELCDGVHWQRVRIADKAQALRAVASGESWHEKLEISVGVKVATKAVIPPILASIVPNPASFSTLGDLGVSVGQGLRTGANEFFYVTRLRNCGCFARVQLSKLFAHGELDVPAECIQPVVRKQADLPSDRLSIDYGELLGCVLALQGWKLPECSGKGNRQLPNTLAAHVRRAGTTCVGRGARAKLLPELSAVAPNARSKGRGTGYSRYWFTLPEFVDRHRPDVFVARVNSGRPRTFLNRERASLVDANFSTLWLTEDAQISRYILFAYLNSTFAWTFFEHLGSVMGGGALKLEAAHLSRLPVPRFGASELGELEGFGRSLSNSLIREHDRIISAIDGLICRNVFGERSAKKEFASLKAALRLRLRSRKANGVME